MKETERCRAGSSFDLSSCAPIEPVPGWRNEPVRNPGAPVVDGGRSITDHAAGIRPTDIRAGRADDGAGEAGGDQAGIIAVRFNPRGRRQRCNGDAQLRLANALS